jgi:hypothetical protein
MSDPQVAIYSDCGADAANNVVELTAVNIRRLIGKWSKPPLSLQQQLQSLALVSASDSDSSLDNLDRKSRTKPLIASPSSNSGGSSDKPDRKSRTVRRPKPLIESPFK